MEYKIIKRLSKSDYENLKLLIDKCNGYEPFYLLEEDLNYDCVKSEEMSGCEDFALGEEMSGCEDFALEEEMSGCEDYGPEELHQLAAYDDNGNMIGFISFIHDEDFNCCAVSGDKENYYKDLSSGMPKDLPELTAIVAPKYRHQQIFSKMFELIKKATGIDAFIVSGSLQKEPAFSEYLMQLTRDECVNFTKCVDSTKYVDSTIFSDSKAPHKPSTNKNCDRYSFCFEECDSVYAMYDTTASTEDIAYCRLSFQPSFNVISNVYVDEKLRGNGLGSIFMEHFVTDYFSKYKKPLVLNVRSINIPAVRIYQKCGFKIIETVKYYVI